MSGMFSGAKKADGPVYAPDKDDERQRLAALAEIGKTGGGRASTSLTSGLAASVPRSNNVNAPKTAITGGL